MSLYIPRLKNMNVLDNLLFNLNIISKIPPGTKIITTEEFINIEQPAWCQSLSRLYRRESRTRMVTRVSGIVESVIAYSKLLHGSQEFVAESSRSGVVETLTGIRDALNAAHVGIQNLIETYSDDNTVVAHLNTVQHTLRNYVRDISVVIYEHRVARGDMQFTGPLYKGDAFTFMK